MEISILVPAWNNFREVERFIKQAKGLDATTYVVVGPARDYHRAKQLQSGNVHVLEQKKPNKNAALQETFAHVRTSHIFLTDIDAQFDQAWLDTFVAKAKGVTTTWFKPPSHEMRYALAYHHYQGKRKSHERKEGPAQGLCGACTLIPYSVITPKDFDPSVRTGTDYVLGQRLLKRGESLHHIDHPVIVSYHTRLIPYLRQQRRWIRNMVIHTRRAKDERDLLRTLRSITFSVLFWVSALTGLVNPYLLSIPGAMLGYGVVQRMRRGGRPFSAAYHALAEHAARGLAGLDLLMPWRWTKW